MSKDKILNILKAVLVLGLIFGAYKLMPYMNVEAIRSWVDSFGNLGPIIYIGLWTLLPVMLFPVPPLALPGGILFGFWKGLAYLLIGVFLNSSLMFLMSRILFKDQIKDFLMPRLPESVSSRLYIKNQKSLWIFFFILRYLPLVSYNLINYAAGLTEMKYRHYFSSTMLGILPGALIYINLGEKALDPWSPGFFIAIGLTLLLVVSSIIVAKIYMPEGDKDGKA